MTVLEAMNLLGLNERPDGQADFELAMARALKQTPHQRELLEEAGRSLRADLETRASDASRLTSTQRHSTGEILLFDENRDAVVFGDKAGPELPVPFQTPLADDGSWLGDDSVIFEGGAAMMSEVVTAAPAAPPEPSANEMAETLDGLPHSDTSISGEWQLMLESLEAEGLVKPEEGFSDALPVQMIALHDTPPERLVVNPALFDLDNPIFAPLEPAESAMESPRAELLETPLFFTPLLETPLLSTTQPEPAAQLASGLETPLFAALALPTSEQAQVITFDESLLISHGGSLTDGSDRANLDPTSVAAAKTLESLPSRKAPAEAQLSIKPAAAQPSEQPSKRVTGRAGIAPANDALRTERRSPRSATAQTVAPRTYRDAREPPAPVRRRRQPVAVWLLSVAALLGSAVFIAPNLAAQLRDQLLPRAAAPIKPSASAVVKPPVRVVKPAAITPARSASSSAKTLKPADQTTARTGLVKPSVVKPSASKPAVSKAIVSSKPSAPRVAVAVKPPRSAVTAPQAATVVKPAAAISQASKVIAAISSASSLPPVTRPEGFASAGATKPAKPPSSIKPAAAPARPIVKPVPPSAPVASIEYQDKPAAAAAAELPGGLSRQEFGRQFFNRKQFEVWQAQQLGVRFESFAQIPLETQVLEAEAFRAAVLIPTVRPTRPERP